MMLGRKTSNTNQTTSSSDDDGNTNPIIASIPDKVAIEVVGCNYGTGNHQAAALYAAVSIPSALTTRRAASSQGCPAALTTSRAADGGMTTSRAANWDDDKQSSIQLSCFDDKQHPAKDVQPNTRSGKLDLETNVCGRNQPYVYREGSHCSQCPKGEGSQFPREITVVHCDNL